MLFTSPNISNIAYFSKMTYVAMEVNLTRLGINLELGTKAIIYLWL